MYGDWMKNIDLTITPEELQEYEEKQQEKNDYKIRFIDKIAFWILEH